MPKHEESRLMPYSIDQLYALVADVQQYPNFLPGVTAARIVSGDPNPHTPETCLAELAVRYGPYKENYTSRVHFSPPTDGKAEIRAELEKGPFTHLLNQWGLEEKEGGTLVDFTVDFRFKSRMMEALVSKSFDRMTNALGEAFEKRAKELYAKEGA